MNIPKNVVNPFSEKFLETWELWKWWRKNEKDNFQYKGVLSEQMALKNLSELADGDEQKAIKIVEQSIDRGWTGFYKVKNRSNGKSTSNKQSEEPISLRQQAINEFMRRNGGGEQQGDNTHLKAV